MNGTLGSSLNPIANNRILERNDIVDIVDVFAIREKTHVETIHLECQYPTV